MNEALAAGLVHGEDRRPRCALPSDDPRYVRYHDEEWGRPVTDDTRLFEKVCLEGFQAGLAWSTILYRREGFRAAFADFDIDTVASFGPRQIARLMRDERIVRNRRKIESVINNAGRARELRDEAGTLAAFFWSFEPSVAERPETLTLEWTRANPATASSTRLARALKCRGWSFVGPTTMYALMQSLGLVNDHLDGCAVRAEIERERRALVRPG